MGLIQEDTFPRLVGDVGGTNARFAWQGSAGSALSDIDTLPCAAFPSLTDAIRHYLGEHAKQPPRWCAIGIANPIMGDHVQMTNHDWSFSISAVQAQLGLARFLVINDFTALALSLPALAAGDVRQVGGGHAIAGAPLGLIGPGTGLGVSGLLPEMSGHGAIPINGEGGHVTLAATNEREEQVIGVLRRRFGHASAERAVSGPGLVNIHAALFELAGETAPSLTPQQVTERALSGADARSVEAVDLFFSYLGTVAGNLALSLGARGGMYIGGGVVPRMGGQIDRSRFRESFECKGRFRTYLQEIPTYIVQASMSPALIGAVRALEAL